MFRVVAYTYCGCCGCCYAHMAIAAAGIPADEGVQRLCPRVCAHQLVVAACLVTLSAGSLSVGGCSGGTAIYSWTGNWRCPRKEPLGVCPPEAYHQYLHTTPDCQCYVSEGLEDVLTGGVAGMITWLVMHTQEWLSFRVHCLANTPNHTSGYDV